MSRRSGVNVNEIGNVVADYVLRDHGINFMSELFSAGWSEQNEEVIENYKRRNRTKLSRKTSSSLVDLGRRLNDFHLYEGSEIEFCCLSSGRSQIVESKKLHYLYFSVAQCVLRRAPASTIVSIIKLLVNEPHILKELTSPADRIVTSHCGSDEHEDDTVNLKVDLPWEEFYGRVERAHKAVASMSDDMVQDIRTRIPATNEPVLW